MILVVALAASVLLAGILAAYVLLQDHTIRDLEKTVKVYVATERRLAGNVRVLQEELVHLSASAQVLTLWRPRKARTP